MHASASTRIRNLVLAVGLLLAGPALAQVSDDFSAPALNGALWTTVDPLGDSAFAQANGQLVISVPGGTTHDLWTGGNNSARVIQPLTDQDMEIEVGFSSVPSEAFQIQGLLFQQDASHYLRVDFFNDGTSVRLYATGMTANVPFNYGDYALAPGTAPKMRVTRTGDHWVVSTLLTDTIWVPNFSFDFPLGLTVGGVHAGNVGAPAPAFDMVVDYWFDTAAPIDPEDGTVVDTTAPVLSGIGVQADVTAARVVFATDEPALGAVAWGLTDSLEQGTVAPAGARLAHAVDLTGLTAATTYFYRITATDAAGNAVQDSLRQFTTPGVPNELPTVSLTAPAAGSAFAVGDPILLAATAADADGSVVLVEFLSDGQVVGSAVAAPWEFTWTDAPLGNHDLVARAVDDEGGEGFSATVPLTVNLTAGSPVAVSDDFSALAFDDSLWTFVDPVGGAAYSQVNGLLTLSVPAGTSHDLWDQGNDAVRIMQPVADVDFGLEVKFESMPQLSYQMEGLLIEQDADDFIRYDFFHDGVNLHLFAADIAAGVPTTRLNIILPPSASLWMRLARAGDQWVAQYSLDGTNWSQAGTFARALTVANVGVFAGNAGANPSFDAIVDYFFDVNDPIDPEDGDVVDVLPPVISGLTVTPDVNTAAIAFTTDEPAIGRVSYGLTAGLELGTVTGAGLQTSHTISLTGLDPNTTYWYQVEAEDVSTNLAQEPAAQLTTLSVPNDLPVVTLDAPLDGTHYAVGDTIDLLATATDTDGVVVLVEFLADGQVVGSAVAEPWSFAWTGAAIGNYDLQARATDDVGGIGLSQVATVTVNPVPGEPVAVSDDFSAVAFDDSLWTVVDPRGDGAWFQANGLLTLAIPGGIAHDPWTGGNTTLRAMQPVPDVDCGFEVKFESVPTTAYQMQGLLLEQGPNDYIRIDFFHDGAGLHLFAASITADIATAEADAVLPDGGPLWLRAERVGSTFTVSWSQDGIVWQTAFAFDHLLVLDRVGVFAGNQGSPVPAWEVVVDYFFDINDPIVPEDDGVTDIWPPAVTAIVVTPDPNTGTALVTCNTNEPATAVLSFGLDTGYGTDVPGTSGDGLAHEFVLTGLTPDATYHFAITATDTLLNAATTADQQFVNAEIKPIITVWGGNAQRVGHLGRAQADFNLVGNIFRWETLASLGYTLNGGVEQPLNWGDSGIDYGDGRRLGRDGDFNVDLPIDLLLPGANTLTVRAVDGNGREDVEVVTVTLETGESPLPLVADWSAVAVPQDAGQIVDGHWGLEGGALRTLSTGYDRIFLLGQEDWQDFEVVCPVTINEVLEPVVGVGGPGLGFLMRFTGHIVGGHRNWPEAQPKWGYQPFGGIGWLRWENGITQAPTVQFYHGDYDVEENFGGAKSASLAGPELPEPAPFGADAMVTDFGAFDKLAPGQTFMMKMRCETLPDAPNGDGVTQYSYKVWLNSEAEPAAWNFQVVQQSTYALRAGSLGLLCHYVDVTFGDVAVIDLTKVSAVGDDAVPAVFALADNYPNPFNPMTRIAFELPQSGRVRVGVYDIRGRLVATLADEDMVAGRHEVVWRGTDGAGRPVSSGPYLYRLDAGGRTVVKKMTLLK